MSSIDDLSVTPCVWAVDLDGKRIGLLSRVGFEWYASAGSRFSDRFKTRDEALEALLAEHVRGAEVEPPPSPGVEVQGASGLVSRPDPRPAPTSEGGSDE